MWYLCLELYEHCVSIDSEQKNLRETRRALFLIGRGPTVEGLPGVYRSCSYAQEHAKLDLAKQGLPSNSFELVPTSVCAAAVVVCSSRRVLLPCSSVHTV
jgi:hypothetical protein